jgi:transposase
MGRCVYLHKILRGYHSRGKYGSDWMHFLRYVRGRYPSAERVYLFQNGLSANTTSAHRQIGRRLKLTFVPLPTNASHFSPIETHFRWVRQKVLAAADYWDWRWRGRT